MAVKKNQVYAELSGKKRYLRVENVDDDAAICKVGWRARGGRIAWTRRSLVYRPSALTDLTLFRLEQDVDE